MYFMKVAKKEPEPNKALNAFVKFAIFVGVIVAVFLVVKYICKKHGIKSALNNPCGCGCDDECDCGCSDEDEGYNEDDECECEDACCCGSIDSSEENDEDISGDISKEEKPA